MGPGWQGAEMEAARDAGEAELLRVILAEFPHLEVRAAHGGLIAVPKGTSVIASATMSRLLEKLRAENGPAGGSL